MKASNLFFSAAQLFFVAVIIFLGVLFIRLHDAPHLRYIIANFISQASAGFFLIGYLLVACGLLLLLSFYAMHRGIYYNISMGRNEVFVDPMVIQGYVKEYCKTIFPDQDLPVEIGLCKNQKIEMFIELPFSSLEKQQLFLEKAENELSKTLQRHLGYRREFTLSIIIK
jgi:hypothetical protein